MANSKNVLELTDENFASEIKNAKGVALVDFWAEWCGPCRQLGPTIEAIADEFANQAKIYKMNVDFNQNTPTQFNIRGIPTVIVFKDGQAVDQLVGLQPRDVYAQAIKKNL